jgi:L-asparaginase II
VAITDQMALSQPKIKVTQMGEEAVRVYRGNGLDAIHHASIAVVDSDGNLTHYLGDPELCVMTRSSIKPFQLMPLLLSGAADHFGFTPRQLAIMCGSHNGTDEHRDVVVSNLSLAGNRPEFLQCGCHKPVFMDHSKEYPLHGEDKDALRHNCSGKHSGFLALAKFLGDDVAEYLNPNSKTQTLIRRQLASYCEVDESMPTGIDGCSAPNYALPLKNLALGFKKLANGAGSSDKERAAVTRIRNAMHEFPILVSGERRFDLDLMRAFPGNVVCKVGAESIEGIGFSNPSIGICVKINDGAPRALWPICVAVLKQIGIITNTIETPTLKRHERPEVRNYRETLTGHIETTFTLRRA